MPAGQYTWGADKLSQAIAGLAATLPDNPTVQNLASVLMAELAQYNEPGQTDPQRQRLRQKSPRSGRTGGEGVMCDPLTLYISGRRAGF